MVLEKRESKNAVCGAATRLVEFELSGEEHVMEVYPLTFRMRSDVLSKCMTLDTKTGDSDVDVAKFQFELLKAVVKDSTIVNVPGPGWNSLAVEAGTAMYEAYQESTEPSSTEKDEAKNAPLEAAKQVTQE